MKRRYYTLFIAIAMFFGCYPFASANALVCTYSSGSSHMCQPFTDDVSKADADSRCEQLCKANNPPCDVHAVRDLCDASSMVIPPTNLVPPFSFAASPQALIGRIVGQVVGILGALTFLVFAYGGFMWLTSAGNEEKIASGSQAMLWAVIGLFVVFSSYIIVNVILKSIAR